MIILAEFGRTATLLFLEDSVEIAQVVKPAAIANLRDGMRAVDQHPAGIAQTHVDNIVAEVTTRMQLEEAAERAGTHARETGHIVETDLVHVILADVVLHLQHPSAVAGHLDLGIAAGGEGTCAVASRQLVEDGQELHEGVVAVALRTQRVEQLVDLHDGRHREAETLTGLVHHHPHGCEGIAGKDAVLVGKVELEVNGYLVNILADAVILLPDVFKVGTGDQYKVVIADHLVGVAHDASHTWGMLHKVELEHLMVMDGIGELLLATLGNVEHIFTHQRGNLVYDLRLNHYSLFTFHYSLNLEFFQDFRHPLHVLDAHGHQRQTEDVLDEAHL